MADKLYDFVSDFSAVGDSVKVAANLTIPSGGNPFKLTANSALWDAGDIGKVIGFSTTTLLTVHDPNNPLGATTRFFGSTIESIADAGASVILAHSFNNGPGSLGYDMTDMVASAQWVEWGVDNTPMYEDFHDTAVTWLETNPTDHIILEIPVGRFNLGLIYLGDDLPLFTLRGADPDNRPTISNCCGAYGGHGYPVQWGVSEGQMEAGARAVRIETVAAGQTQVVVKTGPNFPTEGDLDDAVNLFEVGKNAIITGIDLQRSGYPTNPGIWQWLTITDLDDVAGTIDFAEPLEHAYKSTWPHYTNNGALGLDNGGPGTLYAFGDKWYVNQTYRDLIVDTPSAYSGSCGRILNFENILFVNPSQSCNVPSGQACGTYPTMTLEWTMTECVATHFSCEIDKLIGTCSFVDCNIHTLNNQSTAARNYNVTGGTYEVLLGTCWDTVVDGVTATSMSLQPSFFGVSNSVRVENSVIEDFSSITTRYWPQTGLGLNGTLGVSFSEGEYGLVIHVDNDVIAAAGSLWAVPGAYYTFGDVNNFMSVPPGYFQLLDITDDGDTHHFYTSCPGGSLPDWPTRVGPLVIRPHPCPDLTFINCSATAPAGTNDGSFAYILSQSPPNLPYLSYYTVTMNNEDLWPDPFVYFYLTGWLREIRFNVTTAYAGSTVTLIYTPINLSGPLLDADGNENSQTTGHWTVDLKDDGDRRLVVPANAVFPVSWSGGQGSPDVLTALSEPVYFTGAGVSRNSSADVSGELFSFPVSVTVTFITDQELQQATPDTRPVKYFGMFKL